MKKSKNKVINIVSKGQSRRISLQNPALFAEIAKALGFVRVENKEKK